MEELAPQVGPQGTLWVYFAGHGAAAPQTGERVLLGADTQADQATFEARAVRVAELHALADAGKGSAVFVLDTCYAGVSRDGTDIVEGKRFALPSYATAPTPQRIEWTASSPGEWSGPLPGAEHGAFTYLALGALRGWADGHVSGERDGTVDMAEAHAFVTDQMARLSQDQRPHLVGSDALVLSVAGEEAPELDAEELLEAQAPAASGGKKATGLDLDQIAQLRVDTPQVVKVTVDGQNLSSGCPGCLWGIAYDLEPGRHTVQVRSPFGKVVATEEVEIAAGEQLKLFYTRKTLTEVERIEAEPEPEPVPVMSRLDVSSGAVRAPGANDPRDLSAPGDPWFANLHAEVKRTGFDDKKVELIVRSASSRRLTMAELTVLMGEISFEQGREDLMRGMHYLVADPTNYELLFEEVRFIGERRLAEQLWGG
jgi:hypothetical protein